MTQSNITYLDFQEQELFIGRGERKRIILDPVEIPECPKCEASESIFSVSTESIPLFTKSLIIPITTDLDSEIRKKLDNEEKIETVHEGFFCLSCRNKLLEVDVHKHFN